MGQAWARFSKPLVHWWTGKCELARVCATNSRHSMNGRASAAMALQVGTSLRRSRTLQQHTRRLLAPRPTGPRPAAANVRKVHDTSGVASQNGADDDDEKTTSLEAIHLAIVQQKRIPHLMPTSDHHSGNDDRFAASSNLRQCLAGLLFCRRVAAAIERLRSTKVDRSVDLHDSLLHALWSGMRPNVRLQQATSATASSLSSVEEEETWGELGFQNSSDPCSDFRGGGLWALVQLASLVAPDTARYTATTVVATNGDNRVGLTAGASSSLAPSIHTATINDSIDDNAEGKEDQQRAKAARACLALCEDPQCYLPFAATAINFAAWIGDLCAEGRLDEVLLRAYFDHLSTSQGFNDSDGSSGCDGGASVGLDAVHAEFATLFLHQFLNEVWRLQRPPPGGLGIMGFPPLFQAFKLQSMREKYWL